jgi:probable phosphoglycerate mutase
MDDRRPSGTTPGKTWVFLVRHGECEGNREGLFRGRRDFPLNETGRNQAAALAEALRGHRIDRVYTSPLSRATETGEAIAALQGCPVEVRQAFTDIALGPWEGQKKSEVAEEYPVEWGVWLSCPERLRLEGAETLEDVRRRAFASLEALVRIHEGGTFAVVTHRAVIKPLLAACLRVAEPYFWRFHLDNASHSLLLHDRERGWCLSALNRTDHLKEFVVEWS